MLRYAVVFINSTKRRAKKKEGETTETEMGSKVNQDLDGGNEWAFGRGDAVITDVYVITSAGTDRANDRPNDIAVDYLMLGYHAWLCTHIYIRWEDLLTQVMRAG